MSHPIAITEREKAAERERKMQESIKFFLQGQKGGE